MIIQQGPAAAAAPVPAAAGPPGPLTIKLPTLEIASRLPRKMDCIVTCTVAPQDTGVNMTARVQVESATEVHMAQSAALRGVLPDGLAEAVATFAGSEPPVQMVRSAWETDFLAEVPPTHPLSGYLNATDFVSGALEHVPSG